MALSKYHIWRKTMVRVVNIKEDMPPKDYAVFLLDTAIEDSKKMGYKALIVIHGYGSHGKGGDIKKEVYNYLLQAKKHHKITTFVPGDEWGDLNEEKQLMCQVCPQLLVNEHLYSINSGVTAILL